MVCNICITIKMSWRTKGSVGRLCGRLRDESCPRERERERTLQNTTLSAKTNKSATRRKSLRQQWPSHSCSAGWPRFAGWDSVFFEVIVLSRYGQLWAVPSVGLQPPPCWQCCQYAILCYPIVAFHQAGGADHLQRRFCRRCS